MSLMNQKQEKGFENSCGTPFKSDYFPPKGEKGALSILSPAVQSDWPSHATL